MRNLLLLGALLVAASMAGWFQVNRQGDRTTIEINRDEIRSDARRAIDRGRDFLDQREQQQYADQQQPQQYDQQGQPVWPQEQVAVQQDAWGNQQPTYNAPAYQNQQFQQQQQYNQYQQQQPVTR